ncbi:MAG: aminotransferase class V-fold PLP-dependent enzyme [Wenzhouxiangellaceae bacterium]
MSFLAEEYREKLIQDFPALSRELDGTPITYLDNAATTLKPRAMVDAVNEYYLGISTNIHRGKHYAIEEVSNRYEQARYKVAELIGCGGNEVVFVRNTTEGVNLVADGLGVAVEDHVVIFSDAHHSNMLPWLGRGQVHHVRFDEQGAVDWDHYESLLKLEPKVVAMTSCSNVTGIHIPLERAVGMAKQVGALVLVDGAQTVPHRRINVGELDVDFLSFSAHKMIGPTGIGILYGKRHCLEKLRPNNLGGGMVDWVELGEYRLRKIPHRFEAGTPHIAGAYGLGAAIDYLNQLGFDQLREDDRAMGRYMLEQALARSYLRVVNPDSEADRGGVISVSIPGQEKLDDFARILSDSYGVMCRNGHLCAQPYLDMLGTGQVLRASAYFYTRREDVDRFFSGLDEIAEMLLDNTGVVGASSVRFP